MGRKQHKFILKGTYKELMKKGQVKVRGQRFININFFDEKANLGFVNIETTLEPSRLLGTYLVFYVKKK